MKQPEERLYVNLISPMKAELERLAARNDRSLTAEVRRALREHLAKSGSS